MAKPMPLEAPVTMTVLVLDGIPRMVGCLFGVTALYSRPMRR
jgi:hypothetical protein